VAIVEGEAQLALPVGGARPLQQHLTDHGAGVA